MHSLSVIAAATLAVGVSSLNLAFLQRSTPEAMALEGNRRKTSARPMTIKKEAGGRSTKIQPYQKWDKNKRTATHISIEQHWTSSTSGSTVQEKCCRYHKKGQLERKSRHRSRHHRKSGSFSISAEIKNKKHKKRLHKRGLSVQGRKHTFRHRNRSKAQEKRKGTSNRHMTVKVKGRKHRHHTRHITVDEQVQSSTYAFDVQRQREHSATKSGSSRYHGSGSYSSKSVSFSASVKKHKSSSSSSCSSSSSSSSSTFSSRPCAYHKKRLYRRAWIEGKPKRRQRYSLGGSASYSKPSGSYSYGASHSYSQSSSGACYEFERIAAKPCPLKRAQAPKKGTKKGDKVTKVITKCESCNKKNQLKAKQTDKKGQKKTNRKSSQWKATKGKVLSSTWD